MLGGEGGVEGVVRTGEGSSVVATVAVALLLGEAWAKPQATAAALARKSSKARKQNEKTQKQNKKETIHVNRN